MALKVTLQNKCCNNKGCVSMFFSLERFTSPGPAIALLGLVCPWEKGSPKSGQIAKDSCCGLFPLGQSGKPTTQSCVHLQICCREGSGCVLQSLPSSVRREWTKMQMSRYPQLLLLLCNSASEATVPRNRHSHSIYRTGPVRWEEGWENPRLGDSCVQW